MVTPKPVKRAAPNPSNDWACFRIEELGKMPGDGTALFPGARELFASSLRSILWQAEPLRCTDFRSG
jgi:hypothetical protein